jgi:transposase
VGVTVAGGAGVIAWPAVPVYLHRQPVDFRKSINGLSVVVEQAMGLSPLTPGLFVFCSRRRDKLKVLYWDKPGFCLWYKRLERDRFQWPRSHAETVMTISDEQFEWLLRGFDILKMQPHAVRMYTGVT